MEIRNKNIWVVLMATLLSVSMATATSDIVGDNVEFEVNLQCSEGGIDTDFGDGTGRYLYYAWDLTDPSLNVEQSLGLTQLNSGDSKMIDVNQIVDEQGLWTLEGKMYFVEFSFTGTGFLITDSGFCDTETDTVDVETAPVCGNGLTEGAEECDDGNTADGDGCSSACVAEYCGDGIIQPGLGEECDTSDLDGETCQTQGFFSGELHCSGCVFDTTDCNNNAPSEESYEPTDDAKVAAAQPTTKFGLGRYAAVWDKGTAKDRFWLEFDISGSEFDTVNSAMLDIEVYITERNVAERPIQAYYCNYVQFDEATITWATQPQNWDRYGNPIGGRRCVLADEYTPLGRVIYSYPEEWSLHSWDLADEVNNELQNGDGKFSIVLKYASEDKTSMTDHWAYYLTNNYVESQYRPHLTIQ